MLSCKSLEVVLIVVIVSIILRKAVWDPPGLALLMLLVVIVRFRWVIILGSVSILGHGAHVCEEGLRRASVLVGQVPQTARQVWRC